MKNSVVKPLITEKSTFLQSTGVYVFGCSAEASKGDIKKFIEKNFNVNVVKVNTSLCRTRLKRSKSSLGRIVYFKKAYVHVSAGQKIALFEGV